MATEPPTPPPQELPPPATPPERPVDPPPVESPPPGEFPTPTQAMAAGEPDAQGTGRPDGTGQSAGGPYPNPHSGKTEAGTQADEAEALTNGGYHGGGQQGARNWSDRDHHAASKGRKTQTEKPGQR
jgi:hypothetical protein